MGMRRWERTVGDESLGCAVGCSVVVYTPSLIADVHSYVKWTQGGDASAGRFLSGESVIDFTFGQVGGHFHPFNADMSDAEWAQLVPGYYRYPDVFRRTTIPVLVAVCIRHILNGDIEMLFPDNHPYRRSVFFLQRSKWERLVPLLAPPAMHSCTCGIVVTGTSALSVCLSKLIDIQDKLTNQASDLRLIVESFRDRVDVVVRELPSAVASRMCEQLRDNFNVEGVSAVNRNDLRNMFDEYSSRLQGVIETNREVRAPPPPVMSVVSSPVAGRPWWRGGPRNGKATVPVGLPVRSMWIAYLFGNEMADPKELPFSVLVNSQTTNPMELSRVNLVFGMLKHAISLTGKTIDWVEVSEKGDATEALQIFDRVFPLFVRQLSPTYPVKATVGTIGTYIHTYFKQPGLRRNVIVATQFIWEDTSQWDNFWEDTGDSGSSSASPSVTMRAPRVTDIPGPAPAMVAGFIPPPSSMAGSAGAGVGAGASAGAGSVSETAGSSLTAVPGAPPARDANVAGVAGVAGTANRGRGRGSGARGRRGRAPRTAAPATPAAVAPAVTAPASPGTTPTAAESSADTRKRGPEGCVDHPSKRQSTSISSSNSNSTSSSSCSSRSSSSNSSSLERCVGVDCRDLNMVQRNRHTCPGCNGAIHNFCGEAEDSGDETSTARRFCGGSRYPSCRS